MLALLKLAIRFHHLQAANLVQRTRSKIQLIHSCLLLPNLPGFKRALGKPIKVMGTRDTRFRVCPKSPSLRCQFQKFNLKMERKIPIESTLQGC